MPRLVLRGKNIYEVSAGRYHSTAISAHGVLYGWGCGESGQLGHNSVENECFPRVVESLLGNVIGQISCGEHHTIALSCKAIAISTSLATVLNQSVSSGRIFLGEPGRDVLEDPRG